VYSSAGARVSQNAMGTLGQRAWASVRGVCDERRLDPVELEDLRVAVLDDHRRTGRCREFAERVAQLAAGQAGDQVA
jgi:hypothetical protein